ncbi:CPBP family intramembrane glutamic endopeptidase [Mobilicoccus pelagius]|uniref:CAAX prenyl protease 2/Lysostaphin resistance protein A-like domain-containing protein n=1 Tax=Mobilicoccus pelagius NBRC 104925 TaxID=1089455 RepID=H5UW21_9MICO|nr:CPBP family intramembrane glutamic endopeptidase [Mobilicoccus pelagius]GAB49929.1 hypothetical protein MOPEL_135_01670 [Mobilicoccus pelagius NBRC 104925]
MQFDRPASEPPRPVTPSDPPATGGSTPSPDLRPPSSASGASGATPVASAAPAASGARPTGGSGAAGIEQIEHAAPQGEVGPWGVAPQPSTFTPPSPTWKPLRLPLVGHTYPEVLRTPRWRWWHAPVAWPLAFLLGAIATILPMVVYAIVAALRGAGDPLGRLDDVTDPTTMFVLDVSLALLPVAALLAVAAGHRVSARFLHSVEGRVRWGWLLRCVLVLLPLFAVYIVGAWFLDGSRTEPRPAAWPWLLVLTFVMTPLQAAGEEYLFRGFVLTTIGSYFRRPLVGLVVAGAVSCGLFAAAHGSADPWIITDLAGMAAGCVYLAWRTGGLEAGIALHVVNNVVVGVVGILNGTITESYVDTTTTGTPGQAIVSVVVTALFVAVLDRQYRRSGLTRTVPPTVGALP